ncbi:MAG: acyl-CoA/acyl-ACP dehydrogenase [Pirellulaceae bacterium]|nr:acyl-CoA/acyl-ACP dehydrogenase [Pirellulaceae bacterium]
MSNHATVSLIQSPDDSSLDDLCDNLSQWASRWTTSDTWPGEALDACARAGVYRWFLPVDQGGFGWDSADQTRGYLRLAQADLTTTFVITQYMGAIRRIAGSDNASLIQQWVGPLIDGTSFGTVGISHLTTSGRHLSKPVLSAQRSGDGFRLDGMAPWVTGAPHADVYVVGATLDDGQELLAAVPRGLDGVQPGAGVSLVALSASCTDRVKLNDVMVDESMLIAGPTQNVMSSGSGARTGGLQTSTLAIGLARAAVVFLADEASRRDDLRTATDELTDEVNELEALLQRAVSGEDECNASDIRGKANRIALRSTQAALTAAKGAGFVDGHPVGRWCRQAMFFLVWSCPQHVAQAHLCELAGIE